MFKKGTRVLLTHPKIQGFIGSTIVTYELAIYLQSIGIEVSIYTHYFSEPASEIFIKNNIHVIFDEDAYIGISDYDIIWVQGQIVPISIIKELNRFNSPFFIFHHMSALEYCADEFPYIPNFENEFSSLSLYVSEECEKIVKTYFKREIPSVYYRNPTPVDFCKNIPINLHDNEIKKILIISNHLPKELLDIKEIMRYRNISVDYYGICKGKYELISKEILTSYDLVVTIGKTVQYCLVLGIPVYIYDHFGGYGYLNSNNYEKAESLNFSGRCGFKLDAMSICKNILNNYIDAKIFHSKKLEYYRYRYNIKYAIEKINKLNVQHFEIATLSQEKIVSYISAQMFSRRFFHIWGVQTANDALNRKFSNDFQMNYQEFLKFSDLKIFRLFVRFILYIFVCLRFFKRFFK